MDVFIADVMLDKLGRWLRIAGVSTVEREEDEDDKLIFQALRDNLILLTADRELARKAKKSGIKTVFISAEMTNVSEQLKLVIKETGISLKEFQAGSLCTKCNNKLSEVETQKIKEKVPESVLERFDKIFECDKCGHVFWKGSHWKEINKKIKELEENNE